MNENSNDIVSDLLVILELFNVYALMLMVIGVVLLWAVNWAMMNRIPTRRFLILQITTLVTFVLYIGGGVALVLGVLQPPKEFLIAAGGSIAVALGFALKDIAASLVAGLLLLFDRPFRVGDRVAFDDTYGEIISIGLRTVRLQTLDDNQVTIPNSRFITDVVASANAGELHMMVVTDFHIALDADLKQARKIIREVIVTSRFAYLKKPVDFAVEEVAIAERLALRIRAKAYVLDVHYEKAFQTDIVTRVAELFREQGIQRPVRQ